MELGERYYQLSLLGRETFMESVAQGALVGHQLPPRMARGTEGSGAYGGASFDEDEVPPRLSDAPANRREVDPTQSLQLGIDDRDTEKRDTEPPFSRPHLSLQPRAAKASILPLCKKAGTPFVDLITLGRTASNDVTLDDLSVSRFQAFFRYRLGRWTLCDAGSRNGTRINGQRLQARSELEIHSGDLLRFGTLEFVFHTADSLFDLLVGSHQV